VIYLTGLVAVVRSMQATLDCQPIDRGAF